jgi:hypothetical protein
MGNGSVTPRHVLTLLTSTLCILVSIAMATTPSGAMIGGIPQNPQPTWAVKIDTGGGLGCSGALIASQWVLSAAHCFGDKSESLNGVTATLAGGSSPVDIVRSTAWFPSSEAGYLAPDLALIHLTQAIPGATPLPIATESEVNSLRGQGVTFFGFGAGNGVPLFPSVSKTQDGEWTLDEYCPTRLASLVLDCFQDSGSTGEAVVVGGDSGGAWVGLIDGQWKELAAETGYSGNARDQQYGTSVTRLMAWISNVEGS